MNLFRPTWVEVSSSAFRSNLRALKQLCSSTVSLCPVLKADGYGHGAIPLARISEEEKVPMIGVSSIEEGIVLREAGIGTPIFILGGIYPFTNYKEVIAHNFIPTVASIESARALATEAKHVGKKIPFHLKVDTGMGRIGISLDHVKSFFSAIKKDSSLWLDGIYSHLSSADSDPVFTKAQIDRFQTVADLAASFELKPTYLHLANSAGHIGYPDSRFTMVRPGISLYGVNPLEVTNSVPLSPVLSWQTRAIFLKKVSAGTPISYGQSYKTKETAEIVTLPVGYADGLPRLLSNKGFVLINGKRCPIVGRITMDQTMVDATGIKADIGSPVVLIGKQGKEEITAQEWGEWAGTISYEIFCGISKRVPRIGVS